jgi:membrane protein
VHRFRTIRFSLWVPQCWFIVSLLGIFFGQDAIRGRIFGEISSITGATAARQIQEIIQNIELTGSNIPGLITGGVILFLTSTGVFTEMQDSINYIWSVKAKPKKGWLKFIVNRALSFSLLLGFGFILLVSLVLNSLLEAVSQRLFAVFPHTLVIVAYILNLIVMFIITTSLFCMIYKILPDAIIGWRDAYKGRNANGNSLYGRKVPDCILYSAVQE